MTILVTGGTGYIGSHTCVELLQLGMHVVIVDNLSNSNREVLNRIEAITGKRPDFYMLDVCDEQTLTTVFDRHAIDCVIHFAGKKAVGESLEAPIDYYQNNLGSTLALCRVMEAHGVRKLVFSSSATVYSGDNQMPLQETAKIGCCTNPYGWTKYMSEQIIRDVVKTNPAWSAVLLRYFNPVGAHESGLIGEDPKDVPNNLMPYIAQTAVGRRDYLRIFGDDYDTHDGTGIRDYIHVTDLAKGHVTAIDWVISNHGTEIFNLGTGKGYSVLEMVQTFERINGVEIPYRITARRLGDLPICYADTRKSKNLLRWSAEKTLEDMCRDAWHWQKQNPMGYTQKVQGD